MANLDPVVSLYTSRSAVRGFVQNPYLLHYADDDQAKPLGDAAALARTLATQHVNYVLQTPDALYREGPFLKSLLSDFSQLHPGALLPLSKEQGSSLLQVIPPATLRVQTDLNAQSRMVNLN